MIAAEQYEPSPAVLMAFGVAAVLMALGGVLLLRALITRGAPEALAAGSRAASDLVGDIEAWLRGQGY